MEHEASASVPSSSENHMQSVNLGAAASRSQSAAAAALPDSANECVDSERVALNWVGMRGIAIPIDWTGSVVHASATSVSAWVDLVDTAARGIHMSRIYEVLQTQLANRRAHATTLRALLDAMLKSQAHLSRSAQVDLSTDLMVSRPALISPLTGWQRYPTTLRARKSAAGFEFEVEVSVGYSSTCPSSAALAQRAQADAFSTQFGSGEVSASVVASWLARSSSLVASAHAQRSEARLRIRVADHSDWPDPIAFVDRCELALGTPLQTAVKRVDEQAFAMRNAQHLMFCEDAARRLHAAFATDTRLQDFDIRVAHFESLHAHDAVAHVSRSGEYRSLNIAD